MPSRGLIIFYSFYNYVRICLQVLIFVKASSGSAKAAPAILNISQSVPVPGSSRFQDSLGSCRHHLMPGSSVWSYSNRNLVHGNHRTGVGRKAALVHGNQVGQPVKGKCLWVYIETKEEFGLGCIGSPLFTLIYRVHAVSRYEQHVFRLWRLWHRGHLKGQWVQWSQMCKFQYILILIGI